MADIIDFETRGDDENQIASDVSDDGTDDEDPENELDEDEAAYEEDVKRGGVRTSKERIVRTGKDRTTLNKLNKFEHVNCVIEMAKQLESGAKIPELVKDAQGITNTEILAYKSVMATVRHSLDETKTDEQISKGASIIVVRDVGTKYSDHWALHELIYFEPHRSNIEEVKESTDTFLVDHTKINLGKWFDM